MRVGIATGGFTLREELLGRLRAAGHEVVDFGAHGLDPTDDYPDFVVRFLRPSRPERSSEALPSAEAESGLRSAPTKYREYAQDSCTTTFLHGKGWRTTT
jgi:hypothetical protein